MNVPRVMLPEPGYVAPDLGRSAEAVRDFLELELAGPGHIALAVQYIRPLSVELEGAGDWDAPWPVRLADIYRARGLAPYVGAPFVYEWLTAIDRDTGRPVAASKVFTRYLPGQS